MPVFRAYKYGPDLTISSVEQGNIRVGVSAEPGPLLQRAQRPGPPHCHGQARVPSGMAGLRMQERQIRAPVIERGGAVDPAYM